MKAASTESPIDLENEARERRRRARQAWPIRRYNLGEEPSEDLSETTTAAERLAMIWPLTVLSWRLAGRDIPEYKREDMPGTVLRSGVSD